MDFDLKILISLFYLKSNMIIENNANSPLSDWYRRWFRLIYWVRAPHLFCVITTSSEDELKKNNKKKHPCLQCQRHYKSLNWKCWNKFGSYLNLFENNPLDTSWFLKWIAGLSQCFICTFFFINLGKILNLIFTAVWRRILKLYITFFPQNDTYCKQV